MVTLTVENFYFAEMRRGAPTIVSLTLIVLFSAPDTPIQLCGIKKQIILLLVFFIGIGLRWIRQVVFSAEI